MHFSPFRALIITSLLVVGVSLIYLSSWHVGESHSLIIIDTSLSMAIEDIRDGERRISRLDLAKKIATEEIQKSDGNIALMTYARSPALLSPLSRDQRALTSLIDSLEPRAISGGSDLTSTLELAKGLYSGIPLTLSIYTDGGSTNPTLPSRLPRLWKVSLFGIGTTQGGRIPLGYNADGTKRYKNYSGSELIVRYEEDAIGELGDAIGSDPTHITDSRYSSLVYSGASYKNLFFIGLVLAFLGFFFHPYVRK